MAFGTLRVDSIQNDGGSTKQVANLLDTSAVGSSVQAFDADTAKTDVANTYTAPQRGEVTAVAHSSATIAIDFSVSNNFHIQLVSGTANVTSITASGAVAGQSGSIFIQQPASGTAVTFSGWASEYKFPARTPLAGITATLGGVDRVDYVVKDPNEIHCVSTLDMAP